MYDKLNDIQKMVLDNAGKGKQEISKKGEKLYKEILKLNSPVGKVVTNINGEFVEKETNYIKIHYSKTGLYAVPLSKTKGEQYYD
jgi:hypothetical protein